MLFLLSKSAFLHHESRVLLTACFFQHTKYFSVLVCFFWRQKLAQWISVMLNSTPNPAFLWLWDQLIFSKAWQPAFFQKQGFKTILFFGLFQIYQFLTLDCFLSDQPKLKSACFLKNTSFQHYLASSEVA